MDPFTLATISIGGSAASGALGFFGAKREGQASADMYNYKSGMAAYNAKMARQNRDYALTAGEAEAVKYGLGARNRAGQIEVAQAASGVDINKGSPVAVREGQKYITNMDLATIRSNATRRAYAYEAEAYGQDVQSEMYSRASKDAKEAGDLKAIGSLISGATSVSSKWLQAKQQGIYT